MSYLNSEGVLVRTGPDQADPAVVTSKNIEGPLSVIEVDISQRNLPAFTAGVPAIASQYVKIPGNTIVERVDILVEVAFDSAADTATLNVGYVDNDGTSNANADGFIKAATVAELTTTGVTTGASSPLDDSGMLGRKFTASKYITWDVGTQDFNAGVGKLRIYFSQLDKTTDTLGD